MLYITPFTVDYFFNKFYRLIEGINKKDDVGYRILEGNMELYYKHEVFFKDNKKPNNYIYVDNYGNILNYYGEIITHISSDIDIIFGKRYQKVYSEFEIGGTKGFYLTIENNELLMPAIEIKEHKYTIIHTKDILDEDAYIITNIQNIGEIVKITTEEPDYGILIYEDGSFKRNNLTVTDIEKYGIKDSAFDTYSYGKSLGYSFYAINKASSWQQEPYAIYSYKDNRFLSDFKFNSVYRILDQNSKIIVGQFKMAWNFQVELFFGVFDLNEEKLIKSCRYSYEEMEDYIKKSFYTKIYNIDTKIEDPELEEAIKLTQEYLNWEEVSLQKKKEVLELEEMIKNEERELENQKHNALEKIKKDYEALQENFVKLEDKKKNLQKKYGMDIEDLLKRVEE